MLLKVHASLGTIYNNDHDRRFLESLIGFELSVVPHKMTKNENNHDEQFKKMDENVTWMWCGTLLVHKWIMDGNHLDFSMRDP